MPGGHCLIGAQDIARDAPFPFASVMTWGRGGGWAAGVHT